jgi:uncharacterized protein (DUF362 family)
MEWQHSVVIITQARELDYSRDYVTLPAEYGTPTYEQRQDVQAIRAAVNENLRRLDESIHFTDQIRGRKVVLKPNLVTVFHDLGTRERDYPETTDPRLLDAVVLFLQQYTSNIIIAESSGRGVPTRLAFHIAGLDRLSRLRNVQLMALEEQPTECYLLPKARVMREIVVPQIFSEIIRGEAFYISLPKMKTNLYTGVTLGFKNAMGVLSYNLRQRNHTYQIDQKLVDILHLFKADLVIIDGIVGGQGNCPAPVEPVQSRVIVSGNHSVETDRVATRLMGLDPAQIPLMQIADENGFNDPAVEVIGEQRITPYRPADPSLLGEWMQTNFPNVRVLVGHTMNHAPQPDADGSFTLDRLCALESVCRGGCHATTRYAFDMLYHEGKRRDFRLNIILGAGCCLKDQATYYDTTGKPYSVDEIARLPGKKLAIGTCAAALKPVADRFVDGCMPFPNSPHMLIHQLSGTTCAVISPRNRYLLRGLLATLQMREARKKILRRGQRIDIPLSHENKLYPLRTLTGEEKQMDFIQEPFAPLTPQEIRELCAAEDRNILATFTP